QIACGIIRASRQLDPVQPFARAFDRRAFGPCKRREAEDSKKGITGRQHQIVVLGHQQILEHGHARKKANVLKSTGDPRLLRYKIVRHSFEQIESVRRPSHRTFAAVSERLEPIPGTGITMAERNATFGWLVETG